MKYNVRSADIKLIFFILKEIDILSYYSLMCLTLLG
jgi:hypothetical protein